MHHDAGMRTTVTLDPDTHRLVQRAMRARGATFKEIVNAAIQRGLMMAAPPERPPFVLQARSMGLRVTDAEALRQLDDDAEMDRFLKVSRRLQESSG